MGYQARRPAIPARATIATTSGIGSRSFQMLARTRLWIIPRSSSARSQRARGLEGHGFLHSAGGTKASQGVSSPWLRLNRWRLGSRSRSDAVYDTALAILYLQVLPGDHDVSSAEFAPQDEHVTASVRPPLAAQASHLAEFSIILCCPRGRRGRVFRTYRRHLSIVPPGSSEVGCSTFAAETHTATRLLGMQAGGGMGVAERRGASGRERR